MNRGYKLPAKGLAQLLTRTSRLPPTPSQQALVDAAMEGSNLVCIAYAGSGKTGAAVEIAHQSGAKGYLVLFNRAAKDDAAGRLPPNVTAETGHSLAFKHVIEPSPGYTKKLTPALPDATPGAVPFSPKVIAETLPLKLNPRWHLSSKATLAHLVYQTLQAFIISADKVVSSWHVPENVAPPTLMTEQNAKSLIDELTQCVVQWSADIWAKMRHEHNGFPITHDTYVKLLQLRGDRIPADLWLLDEYQDTTPAMADLINHQEGQKIYIGDPYQAIYGWRGAIDALRAPIASGVPIHYLQESFRYNHQIAGLATLLLRSLGESVPVKGQPRDLYPINEREPHTYLARNNLSLLACAIDCVRRGQRVAFAGGLPKDTLTRVKSALALHEGRHNDIRMGALRQFSSWRAYTSFVDQQTHPHSDQRRLVRLIESSANWLPRVLQLCETGKLSYPDPGAVLLITAHKAKGRQWPYVKCDSDLALPVAILDKLRHQTALTTAERESVHLLYVAITRAQLGLSLAPPVKRTFSELSSFLSKPEDTPAFFSADTVSPPPQELEEAIRRHRTDEFIRTHRQSD